MAVWAWEKASKENPDLIICDIMMPELDGYGVLYLLSKNPSTASIPFIFLMPKAEKADLRKGMSMGADDYLTKPFEEMELLNAVEARLRKSDVFRKEFTKNIEGLNEFPGTSPRPRRVKQAFGRPQSPPLQKEGNDLHGRRRAQRDHFVVKGRIKTYKTNEDGKNSLPASIRKAISWVTSV